MASVITIFVGEAGPPLGLDDMALDALSAAGSCLSLCDDQGPAGEFIRVAYWVN